MLKCQTGSDGVKSSVTVYTRNLIWFISVFGGIQLLHLQYTVCIVRSSHSHIIDFCTPTMHDGTTQSPHNGASIFCTCNICDLQDLSLLLQIESIYDLYCVWVSRCGKLNTLSKILFKNDSNEGSWIISYSVAPWPFFNQKQFLYLTQQILFSAVDTY